MKTWTHGAAALGLLVFAGAAQAALVDRGGGMIYDTTRNITWLADMNQAKSSGHDSDGRMDWATAKAWAESLVHGGYSDWRLPTLDPWDTSCSNSFDPGAGLPRQYYGYRCTGSELAGLFVTDLGNRPDESVLVQVADSDVQKANFALFSNVQSSGYWSGISQTPHEHRKWYFDAHDGTQFLTGAQTDIEMFAVAVRNGDVAGSVPEPQTLALVLMALVAAAAARERRVA